VQVTHDAGQAVGGSNATSVRLFRGNHRLGVSVGCLSVERSSRFRPLDGVTHFLPPAGLRRIGACRSLELRLDELASTGVPFVVHQHGVWLMTAGQCARVCRRHSLPMLVSTHGTLAPTCWRAGSRLKPAWWRLASRPALAQASCLHATSELEADEIRARGLTQPIAIIPWGVDVPHAVPSTAHKGSCRTVMYLGRLVDGKGIDDLLRAWQLLEGVHRDWSLRIVGPTDGPNAGALCRLAGVLGLRRVTFAGAVHGSRKWEELASAELLVLPSHSENFGLVVAEALAAGTPVVTSSRTPWSELPGAGLGWQHDPGVLPLVGALGEAMGCSSGALRAMGVRGREWIRENRSWNRCESRFGSLYAWMLGWRGVPDDVQLRL
jgi:glycosyltransferase involved in cell wall biosynthesis